MRLPVNRRADALLDAREEIRYVACLADGELFLRQRPALCGASSAESDKYEELIVNPTLLTLVARRGEIDCGGAGFVLIRYGNFYQFVAPLPSGHLSIGMQPDCNPLSVLQSVGALLREDAGVELPLPPPGAADDIPPGRA